MEPLVPPQKYLRDALGAVVSLGTVIETVASADWRVMLELHRLGWLENRLRARSEENLVARLQGTIGIADDLRAVCFARIWIRGDVPAESTVELLTGEFLDRAANRALRREIHGEVTVCVEGGAPFATPPQFRFALFVGFDRCREFRVPAVSPAQPAGWERRPYVEIDDPLRWTGAAATSGGEPGSEPA